jgi:hypothetical protein
MASNVAFKRTKRARQRKQAVARRRQLELVESAIGARARRAASAPIRLCALHGEVAAGAVEGGVASVILARGRTAEFATAAIFLVDTFCLGIKNVIFRDLDSDELAFICERMSETAPLAAIEPAHARGFLREAAAWGASIGFKPHRDFVAAEQLFGDVSADACDTAFTFGQDGKPFYMTGPTETRARIRQRLAHLLARFGPDGFEYAVGL